MILVLPVYMRAILKAASLASVPEVVKKNLFEALRADFEQKLATSSARASWHSRASRSELLRLLGDGVDDSLVLVAEVRAHQLRREVEVALALRRR